MARDENDASLETEESDDVASAVGRGLTALVAVAIAVGLCFGLGALVVVKGLGIGGDSDAASTSTASASLYMGDTTPTAAATSAAAKPAPSREATPTLVLKADPTRVGPMERITLSGTYQGGAGSVLTVEQAEGEAWDQFGSVTVTVGGDGTFSTWIQMAQGGQKKFRVTDQDKQVSSAPVAVTIG